MRTHIFVAIFMSLGSVHNEAAAQCFKFGVKKTAVTVKEVPLRKGTCPSGTIAKSSLAGATGATGAAGTPGADAPSLYGDGSGGAFSNSTTSTFSDPNPQYASFSNSGTLSIPSGAVIRVRGDFVNTGTITILTAASPGYIDLSSTTGVFVATQQAPGSGLALGPAANAEFGQEAGDRLGGRGGSGFQAEIARNIFRPGLYGGGGGGSCIANGDTYGGAQGGGTVVFLVGGSFVNDTGTINARGGNALIGGGGGGGGLIIVAAQTSISSAGTTRASGGTGGNGDTVCAPGGGGGGGMIKFISPSITAVGTQTVAGGTAGASSTTSNPVISGGGGGGGSHSNGGAGANAKDTGATGAGSAGVAGGIYNVLADPGALFR